MRWLVALVALGACVVAGIMVLAAGESGTRTPTGAGGGFPAATSGSPRESLPVAFELNRGQAPARYRFIARGAGYEIGLGRGGVALDVWSGTGRRSRLRIVARGGRLGSPRAAAELPGRVNYFLGADRRKWLRGVATFARVGYENVWPGVGLVFHGRQGVLEFDFDLAPGAQGGRVALGFRGARAIRLDGHGGALLVVRGGTLRIPAPRCMQDARRIASRLAVAGDTVRLVLGAYDHARRLLVDPFLVYSTYLGGSGGDGGDGIVAGPRGNVYVSGSTTSRDFPTTPGAYRRKLRASDGGFLAKLNVSGTRLLYSTLLTRSPAERSSGQVSGIDRRGNAYLLGQSSRIAKRNESDVVVTKLNATGSAILYQTHLGGSGDISRDQLVVDSSGDAYITGLTTSTDFPVTPGVPQRRYAGGGTDAFVAKLNPTGSRLLYSTYLGSTDYESGSAIAVDPAGHAYVAAAIQGNIPTTPHAYKRRYEGQREIFVEKLNRRGTKSIYATYLGEGIFASGQPLIAIDRSGASFIGSGYWPHYFTITKLNPAGTRLDYSKGFDVSGGLSSLTVGCGGRVYIGGSAEDGSLPTTPDAYQPTAPTVPGQPHQPSSFFIGRLSDRGKVDYLTYFGSPRDYASSMAVDRTGTVHVAGTTSSLPVTRGAFQTHLRGPSDAFVAKLSLPSLPACSKPPPPHGR